MPKVWILLGLLVGVSGVSGTATPRTSTPKTEPLRGTIDRAAFVPTSVEVRQLGRASVMNSGPREFAETIHVTFKQGTDAWPEKEICLMMQLPQGSKPAGLKVTQKPYPFGSEEYRKQFYPKGNNLAWGIVGSVIRVKPNRQSMPTSYNGRTIRAYLALGQPVGGRIGGFVAFEIDGGKARLRGHFIADIKK